MGISFWVAKISNKFWGMPDIQDISFAKHWIPCPSLRMEKQIAWANTSPGENIGIQVCVSILLLCICLFSEKVDFVHEASHSL